MRLKPKQDKTLLLLLAATIYPCPVCQTLLGLPIFGEHPGLAQVLGGSLKG